MKIKKQIKKLSLNITRLIPLLKIIYYTKNTQTPISLKYIISQKVLRFNSQAYWPVHFTSKIVNSRNVYCGIDTNPGYMPGCYIQAGDKIYIGDYTQIGPNVGIISTNHNVYNNRQSIRKKPICIGKYCWLGINSVILPGVELGDFTIVAAGSVVSKSFKKGYCIIGGNPAEFMFALDPNKCCRFENEHKYNGYIPSRNFEKYRKQNLNI